MIKACSENCFKEFIIYFDLSRITSAYWYKDIGLCSMTACLHPDYNISVTNGGAGACYSSAGGNLDPSKAIPTSVLVAVIVCCILGYLACVGVLLFCIMNYKKRQEAKESKESQL